MKNVTGYDLNKLYTGSCGSLGVIEAAWLRLRPVPGCRRVMRAEIRGAAAAAAFSLEAARRASARAVGLLSTPEPETFGLVVELAGDSPAVERDAEWLGSTAGAASVGPEALDELRALQLATPDAGGVRLRISALASRLGSVLAQLRAGGARLLVHPGLGLVYAGFAAGAGVERPWQLAAEAARAGAGTYRLEAAPPEAKRGRDVFGGPDDAQAVARALKQRFDPAGILNPGRFQGFL